MNGELAVKTARKVIEAEAIGDTADIEFPKDLDERCGVFVSIYRYPDMELRGSMGYPESSLPLSESLISSAQSACHDPRFSRLTLKDADNCLVEVSFLSRPELLNVPKEDIPKTLKLKEDGLAIQFGRKYGALLPQDNDWTAEEFLEQLCYKAKLPKDAWKLKDSDLYIFKEEKYREETPKGRIVRL